ncbi:MAG: TolC family protein [Casimicrobiaceae bacterium]
MDSMFARCPVGLPVGARVRPHSARTPSPDTQPAAGKRLAGTFAARTGRRRVPGAGLRATAAIALVITSLTLAAAPTPLTLAEAQRVAVERSRQLAAQDMDATAARASAVAAGQLPDPVLKAGIQNLPVDGVDRFSLTRDFMTMQSVGVMQEFTRADKRAARVRRFEREADKARAEREAGATMIARDTAVAWLDRHYAETTRLVIAEHVTAARHDVEGAEALYRAGRGQLAEIIAARQALVMLDDRVLALERRRRAAQVVLERWVGERADAPLEGPPDIGRLRRNPEDLERNLRQDPQLRVLESDAALATADVDVARAARHGDWSVEVMYNRRGPAYSNMISLNVSVPLPWDRANRQDREVTAKLAGVDRAEALLEERRRARVAELRALEVEWQSVRERRNAIRDRLVPLAADRTEATLAAYRGARATLTDVLGARRGEIDVRLQLLELESDLARAWAELEFAWHTDAPLAGAGSGS